MELCAFVHKIMFDSTYFLKDNNTKLMYNTVHYTCTNIKQQQLKIQPVVILFIIIFHCRKVLQFRLIILLQLVGAEASLTLPKRWPSICHLSVAAYSLYWQPSSCSCLALAIWAFWNTSRAFITSQPCTNCAWIFPCLNLTYKK